MRPAFLLEKLICLLLFSSMNSILIFLRPELFFATGESIEEQSPSDADISLKKTDLLNNNLIQKENGVVLL